MNELMTLLKSAEEEYERLVGMENTKYTDKRSSYLQGYIHGLKEGISILKAGNVNEA